MRTRRMLAVALPLLVGTLLSASCSPGESSTADEPAQRQAEQRRDAEREDQERQHSRRAAAQRRGRSGSELSDAGRRERLG